MTFKKSSRAGLIALALRRAARPRPERRGRSPIAYAQAPAARPLRPQRLRLPPRRARARSAGLRGERRSQDAVLEKCTPNSGDTAWMLTSVALVLMMTIPGLGLFYGGMVRKKNVGDTVMTSFAITCLVTILWVVCHLQPGVHGRLALSSAASIARSCKGILSDISKGIGNPNPLGADHPRDRLHLLPADLRDHHAGADRRRLRRAHEVLGDAVVHRPVGDLRLFAGRALGVGTGRLPVARQLRRA